MIAVARVGEEETWIIYGSYDHWPSQCEWLVPALAAAQ